MHVLLIIPPYVPSYFNAGHHLPVFQVGAYLRSRIDGIQVTCVDAAALNYHWVNVCHLLAKGFDVVGVMNDFDGVDTFERFLYYVRELTPHARTFTFGRLSKQLPGFFKRYGFDGVVASGDYEAGAEAFVRYVRGETQEVQGVALRLPDESYTNPSPGRLLEAEDWVLPHVEEIPYEAYDLMYRSDLNKFCGIPLRRELVVPAARGCPVNCMYCDVPAMQGLRERRLPVDTVIAYIQDAFQRLPFQYVSFYAPTFTLKRDWVVDLCVKLTELGSPYPWKCVTTVYHLDDELIEAMARSGCVRISVGVEALDPKGQQSLPKLKQDSEAKFRQVAACCRRHNVELNCFVILGLPDGDLEGVQFTVDSILSQPDTRVRPTIYTPYHELRDEMTPFQVSRYNRQLFTDCTLSAEMRAEYYRILYRNSKDRPTTVMDRIERPS